MPRPSRPRSLRVVLHGARLAAEIVERGAYRLLLGRRRVEPFEDRTPPESAPMTASPRRLHVPVDPGLAVRAPPSPALVRSPAAVTTARGRVPRTVAVPSVAAEPAEPEATTKNLHYREGAYSADDNADHGRLLFRANESGDARAPSLLGEDATRYLELRCANVKKCEECGAWKTCEAADTRRARSPSSRLAWCALRSWRRPTRPGRRRRGRAPTSRRPSSSSRARPRARGRGSRDGGIDSGDLRVPPGGGVAPESAPAAERPTPWCPRDALAAPPEPDRPVGGAPRRSRRAERARPRHRHPRRLAGARSEAVRPVRGRLPGRGRRLARRGARPDTGPRGHVVGGSARPAGVAAGARDRRGPGDRACARAGAAAERVPAHPARRRSPRAGGEGVAREVRGRREARARAGDCDGYRPRELALNEDAGLDVHRAFVAAFPRT